MGWKAARVRKRAVARAAFRDEGALCDAFAATARRDGYVVHAETSGWDLLLVDTDGVQIGVEAKLRPNCDVLAQAIGYTRGDGPDIHAVLVPAPSDSFSTIAHALRLVVFDAYDATGEHGVSIREQLKRAPLWEHTGRLWTPPVEIPEVGGGRPNPKQITPWKIAAVRLCFLLRERGYLTRFDFNEARVSITWWVRGRHPLLKIGEKVGRRARYVPTGRPLPDEKYPEVAKALREAPAPTPNYRRQKPVAT